MNAKSLLDFMKKEDTLRRAYHYCVNDRIKFDFYFDYIELHNACIIEEKLIKSLSAKLREPESYKTGVAYAFYPAKTDLCYRRMIYIPIEDLIVRYAFIIALAEQIDDKLSPHCFANRRAKDNRAGEYLLKDFADDCWPAFCNWQLTNIENYSVLVKTDISSFYDSVSHEYFLNDITKQLSIKDTSLIDLLRKLLEVNVVTYCFYKNRPRKKTIMKQGLVTGNGAEGYLANLYLRNIDEAMMKIPNIEFGRYNDDIRIFSNSKEAALKAVLILQELLLTKGLNLNSSKTEIADNKGDIEELRSKLFHPSRFREEEEEEGNERAIDLSSDDESKKEIYKSKIDKDFRQSDRVFSEKDTLLTSKDAKAYCKFIQNKDILPYNQRLPGHIANLKKIVIHWRGNAKFATWLIIQSAFFNGIPDNTQKAARKSIVELLKKDDLEYYAQYRLIHHLVKVRETFNKHRYIDALSEKERNEVIGQIPKLLAKPSFELQLICLYLLFITGNSEEEISECVKSYIPKPLGKPIKKAFSKLRRLIKVRDNHNST